MRAGRASWTAEHVCSARAIADGLVVPGRFRDPIAMKLLSEQARERVARARSGVVPQGWLARAIHGYRHRQAQVMAARTVAIDDAIRAAATPQLVILGAGLDGRAWRMDDLRDAVVFEVDHPDSQREKRARTAGLTAVVREVRFVALDFVRDELAATLERAGHDPARPTTWVWEGVVMYLTRAQIAASLRAIAHRSAPGSRLIVLYHTPAALLGLVGPILRVIGEPWRSTFRPHELAADLAAHGFTVVNDQDLAAIGAALSPELGEAIRFMKHMRLAVADRRA